MDVHKTFYREIPYTRYTDIKLNFKIAVKRNHLKDYSSFHGIFYRNTLVEILVLYHFDTATLI